MANDKPHSKFTRTKPPEQSKPDQPQKRQRIRPSEEFSVPSNWPEEYQGLPIEWGQITYALDWRLEEICKEANELQENPLVTSERKSRLIRRYAELYGERYANEVLRKRYPEAFEKRRKVYPPKWFTDMRKKLTSSRSIRVFDKLDSLWDQFWRCSWTINRIGDRDKCSQLAERLKVESGYVFIDPELDLEAIGERLGYSEWEIWHYREKMVKCRILKKFRKVGSTGPKVYASGYWHEWKGKFIALPYLNEKLFNEIVKEFGFKELERKEGS